MLTQLNPPLPVYISTKNETAIAHAVIDYGPEHHLLWVCFLQSSGQCWTVPNKDIRMEWNYSLGRTQDISIIAPCTQPINNDNDQTKSD